MPKPKNLIGADNKAKSAKNTSNGFAQAADFRPRYDTEGGTYLGGGAWKPGHEVLRQSGNLQGQTALSEEKYRNNNKPALGDVVIDANNPVIKDPVKSALGDQEFRLPQAEVQKIIKSFRIHLHPELPKEFYKALAGIYRRGEEDYRANTDKILSEITDGPIKDLIDDVKKNWKKYGFKSPAHMERVINKSTNELSTNIVMTQEHYAVLGDGNKIRVKPRHPHTMVHLAGIDFTKTSVLDRYINKENYGFKDGMESELNQEIRKLTDNYLRACQAQGITDPSALAIGMGVYLDPLKYNPDTYNAVQRMYFDNLLDLLSSNDYGFDKFYFHIGHPDNQANFDAAFANYHDKDFPCQFIAHNSKDSVKIANESGDYIATAAAINPADQEMLWTGRPGCYWEEAHQQGSRNFVGDEFIIAFGTGSLAHHEISDHESDDTFVQIAIPDSYLMNAYGNPEMQAALHQAIDDAKGAFVENIDRLHAPGASLLEKAKGKFHGEEGKQRVRAEGYLGKDKPPKELLNEIREILNNKRVGGSHKNSFKTILMHQLNEKFELGFTEREINKMAKSGDKSDFIQALKLKIVDKYYDESASQEAALSIDEDNVRPDDHEAGVDKDPTIGTGPAM